MSSVGITPVARDGEHRGGIVWASWFEPLLTIAVVAALYPLFDRVAGDTFGRDARFAERAPIVATLPAPVLGRVCSERGGVATPALPCDGGSGRCDDLPRAGAGTDCSGGALSAISRAWSTPEIASSGFRNQSVDQIR